MTISGYFPTFHTASQATALHFSAKKPKAPALEMKERFQGCLLGVAVADALGCNLEMMSAKEIKAKYGVHQEITGGRPSPKFYNWPQGAYTDDTQMTLMVADSLCKFPAWNPWDLRDRFIAWNKKEPPGRGTLTKRVLELAEKLDPEKDKLDKASRQAYKELNRATNGSLMRCSPIALLYHRDPKKLKKVSDESARLTHFAPACRAATIGYNRVLAAVLNGEITDKASILAIYQKVAEEIQTIDADLANKLRTVHTFNPKNLNPSSSVQDTFQIALWAFYKFTDFEKAIVTVVNLGGDTDTNGAVTGALFGAKLGESAIPPRWLNVLRSREKIRKTAARLFETYAGLSW